MKVKTRKRQITIPRIRVNGRNVLLFSLCLCGVIIGSASIKNSTGTISEIAGAVFDGIYASTSETGMLHFFYVSLLGNMLYLTASFIFGLCAVGLPVVAAIPAVKGIYLGVLCGYLYKTFGVTGIGYSALIICPGAVTACAVLIFACAEGVLTSIDICYLLTQKITEKHDILKAYAGRFGVFAAVCLLASVVDTLLFGAFSGMFTF